MIKNTLIIILTIICISLLVFSFIKQNEAEMEQARALANLELAESHRITAQTMEQKQVETAAKKLKLERLLRECQDN